MSGKVLPVDFGSTEETAQLMSLVPTFEGISGAAAAQVAVLAVLYTRHVIKSGRKPVLLEAVNVLGTPGVQPLQLLADMEESLKTADVTRATRAFAVGAGKSLGLETPVSLRQAFDNAATSLLREHIRRGQDEPEVAEAQAA